MPCKDGEYPSKDGTRCCEQCSAGKHVSRQCEGIGSHDNSCSECPSGSHTSTKNHLNQCLKCSACKAKNQRIEVQCTTNKNTVCGCVSGFYCTNDSCDSCQSITSCPEAHGVMSKATRTNDTVCASCPEGTFNNVSDYFTPCQRHTKCEAAMGREVKTPGNQRIDTVCGPIIVQCSWMLPAGLWSGLVLTCLIILLAIICWRSRRRSFRADIPSVPVQPVPVAHVYPVELSLPATEWIGHCQESCDVKSYELPLYDSGESVVNPCTLDVENGLIKTPLITSDLYVPSNHINRNDSNYMSNSLWTPSEPQEDEWGGT